MVNRLAPLDLDYDDYIDAIVAERAGQGGRNAEYFNGLHAQWKARHQLYLNEFGNPEVIKPWPAITREDRKKFKHLYSHAADDSTQKPVLDNLRSRTLQFCPACGEDGTPNTLDHYLPQNSYAEFAITPANLAPMCDICQGFKLENTVNAANQRLFLHPYFDGLADEQIVVLEIGTPVTAPAIALLPHPDLERDLSALVTRHLEKLEIVRRFHHFFRNEYLHLLRLMVDVRRRGQNVRQQLESFQLMASYKAINSWLHIFYSGVLANNELLEFLENGDLPANL